MSRRVFRVTALIVAIIWMDAHSAGSDQEGEANADMPYERSLHVIVFESMNIKDQLPKDQLQFISLPGADLPARISRLYFKLSGYSKFDAEELGMHGNLSLLDINTFARSEKQIAKSKQVRRYNPIAGLSYSLKVLNREDDSFSIRFSAKYHDRYAPLIAQLSRQTTTLLRIDRLCFAFTFLKAALAVDEMVRRAPFPNPKLITQAPRILKNPLPEYPEELRARRIEGRFFFMAVFTKHGTIDASRGIILDSLHWFFARNALRVVLNDWTFIPGMINNQPADMMITVEVSYRLR
jgi:hypothetical protein